MEQATDEIFYAVIYPNPTSNTVTVDYRLKEKETGVLKFTNPLGQLVKQVTLNAEKRKAIVSVNDLPAGLYFYNVESIGYSSTKGKLVITR